MNSRGHNLIENVAGCVITGVTTGNITGQDPRLNGLAANGGQTHTHALLAGSPAIDAGNPTAPGSAGDACAGVDQRGSSRLQEGNADGTARCDIGAFELTGSVGRFTLSPSTPVATVGEPITLQLTWTVPAPLVWRDLDWAQLRLRDGDTTIFRVRFEEATNTLSLFNEASGTFQPVMAPGDPARLETPWAALHLAGSEVHGSGPTGQSVTLTLALSFKPPAAGGTYIAEVLAANDIGGQQGWETAGALTVSK
jgi:hypothetical protein